MASHKNYNLSANEGFPIFLTSISNTRFIGGFTLEMKSQSIVYLLCGSEHIYWIWDLQGEVHSIWDLWVSGLQECKGNGVRPWTTTKITIVNYNFFQDVLENNYS